MTIVSRSNKDGQCADLSEASISCVYLILECMLQLLRGLITFQLFLILVV